jgi:hypothetical protein
MTNKTNTVLYTGLKGLLRDIMSINWYIMKLVSAVKVHFFGKNKLKPVHGRIKWI